MLPRNKRVSSALAKVILGKKAEVTHSAFFSVRFVERSGEQRFGVVVSKKTAKTAVERNRLRRKTYAILRDTPLSKEFAALVFVKKDALELDSVSFLKELRAALRRADLSSAH